MNYNLIRVILPKYKTPPLDYKIIGDHEIGEMVELPFRGKIVPGIIWEKNIQSNIAEEKIKHIQNKLSLPALSKEFIKLIQWVSFYTLSDLGSVCKLIIPKEELIYKPKTKQLYRLSENITARITKNRSALIKFMQENPRIMTMQEIAQATNISQNSLNDMKKINILELATDKEPIKQEFFQKIEKDDFDLSSDQKIAADRIKEIFEEKKYRTIVLEGVTGAGKTEVFFEVIRKILVDNQGQVLILVPEILLAAQIIERFERKFGFSPAMWHSEISEKNKRIYWQSIVNGEIKIIIGARSALFLPFKDLRLIIVDEEHEASYKQEEGVIYNARDMAVARGFFEHSIVLLSSATPSIETLHNVENGKYEIIKLSKRFGEASLPKVHLVDLRKEKLTNQTFVSAYLRERIINNYKNQFQTILFLNRRGYAPLVICGKCKEYLHCFSCSTLLNYHKKANLLKCHHCDYTIENKDICLNCQEIGHLSYYGPAVEKIVEELKDFIGEARIAIVTKDTVNNFISSQETLKSIREHKIDIIVGTQMIAKGHHFPKITLVGIIDTDFGLSELDLRANERTYQLLYQVSGRAGREKDAGQVVLQSYNPQNPALLSILKYDQEKFIRHELEHRYLTDMPPFSKLVALIIYGINEEQVVKYAENIRRAAPADPEIEIFGPIQAPLSKIKNNYRYRLLLKAKKKVNIQKYIRNILENLGKTSAVKLKIDVDPYNFL